MLFCIFEVYNDSFFNCFFFIDFVVNEFWCLLYILLGFIEFVCVVLWNVLYKVNFVGVYGYCFFELVGSVFLFVKEFVFFCFWLFFLFIIFFFWLEYFLWDRCCICNNLGFFGFVMIIWLLFFVFEDWKMWISNVSLFNLISLKIYIFFFKRFFVR